MSHDHQRYWFHGVLLQYWPPMLHWPLLTTTNHYCLYRLPLTTTDHNWPLLISSADFWPLLTTNIHYWTLLITTDNYYSLLITTNHYIGHYWPLLTTADHYWLFLITSGHYADTHCQLLSTSDPYCPLYWRQLTTILNFTDPSWSVILTPTDPYCPLYCALLTSRGPLPHIKGLQKRLNVFCAVLN